MLIEKNLAILFLFVLFFALGMMFIIGSNVYSDHSVVQPSNNNNKRQMQNNIRNNKATYPRMG